MGDTLTKVKSNQALVEYLVLAEFLKSQKIQEVFKVVDRKLYLPEPHKDMYKDIAIKTENFHLSSPSVYATILENLDVRPGLSFLNIGSGTGYLSTMVGLLLGACGVNHGIELFPDVVEFAKEKVKDFKNTCHTTGLFDFCEPVFVQGNFFSIKNPKQKYDRVYCGGACPDEYLPFLLKWVKNDGILIRATEESLMKFTRNSKATWENKLLLVVCFRDLVIPDSDSCIPVRLNDVCPPRLENICRSYIRSRLKKNIEREQLVWEKKIRGIASEYSNPDNELPFYHNKEFNLVQDYVPRDMEAFVTGYLHKVVEKEFLIEGVRKYQGEIQCSSDCKDDSKLKLKKIPPSLESKGNFLSQNLNSFKKSYLNQLGQNGNTIQIPSTSKSHHIPSTSTMEDNSNHNLLTSELVDEKRKENLGNETISSKCSQSDARPLNSRQFSKDNLKPKQQDLNTCTGIENSKKESREERQLPKLWRKLADFENILQTNLASADVSFSKQMNRKIQDLPLTKSLKEFLTINDEAINPFTCK